MQLKKKKINYSLILLVFVLFIPVSGLSVAFVTVSTLIDTKKYMEGNKLNWDVHFENLSEVYLEGTAKEIDSPIINEKSTSINSFRVGFDSIGDRVTYVFDVSNSGDIDAVITSISIFKPTCMVENEAALEDALLVCSNFDYHLTYLDGTELTVGDLLPKNSKKTLKLMMWYDGTSLPSNSVTVSDISASVIYSQK